MEEHQNSFLPTINQEVTFVVAVLCSSVSSTDSPVP